MQQNLKTVDSCNVTLNALLSELRKADGSQTSKELEHARVVIEDIHEILYTAIEHFPTEVNAISIDSQLDICNTEEYMNTESVEFLRDRNNLYTYLSLIMQTEQLPEKLRYTFNKHLPFRFSTGTHGSGDRAAKFASRTNINFATGFFNNCTKKRFYLELNLTDVGFPFGERTLLRLNEVKHLRLEHVEDSEYSPLLDRVWGKTRIIPAPSGAEGYLNFLGFARHSTDEKYIIEHCPDIIYHPWKQEILKLVNYLVFPDISTGLLKLRTHNDCSILGNCDEITGYVLRLPEEPSAEKYLYSFNHVHIPWEIIQSYKAPAAYAIIGHDKGLLQNVKAFSESDIISELAKAGTSRHF